MSWSSVNPPGTSWLSTGAAGRLGRPLQAAVPDPVVELASAGWFQAVAEAAARRGLTLVAPGVEIVSANPNRSDGYSLDNGTSDATAYVSAAAARVRAKYPDLTAGQVINRLIKSASFLDHKGLKAPDDEYGYGTLRPNKALTMDIPAGPKKNPLG